MSFNYKIACASAVAEGCEFNRSNFFFDGKAMKKENHGTSVPVLGDQNSDSEQCIGVFEGADSSEAAHVAINCLRYFLNQKNEDDSDYIKHLQDFYTASDRVITGLDNEAEKRVSCTVGFVRYNGFYFATAGDCLVYLWRKNELNLLNPPENETRSLGEEGEFSPEPVYGEIFAGDRIVICTASMKKSLSDDKLRGILGSEFNTGECVDTLCKEAVSSGICDCVSCCVIDIGEKTSEGYWILPGLVYVPEEENGEILFESDSHTIEISSGKAFGDEKDSEPEEAPILLPEIKITDEDKAGIVEESDIISVDDIEKNAENKPEPVAVRRSPKDKKKQAIILCSLIAGVLLLGLLMTFIIKGCAVNPGYKSEESTPLVTDDITTEDTEKDDDTTKRKDPERDTEKDTETEDSDDTDERVSDDTTDPVSRDTEDTTEREEPDDTTDPAAPDTDEPATDSTSDSISDTSDTADTADTSDAEDTSGTSDTEESDDTSDSTSQDTESDTVEPDPEDPSTDTTDSSGSSSDTSSSEPDDTTDVVIDDIPTVTDSVTSE